MSWMRRMFVVVLAGGLGWCGYLWATSVKLAPAGEHGLAAGRATPAIQPVEGSTSRVRVASNTARTLGLRFATVEPAQKSNTIRLNGTLGLDPNRLARVHARFEGQVISIGEAAGAGRPLQFGDAVKQGQVLAVLWCKTIGDKKTELLDSLSRLNLDKTTLDRLKALEPGVVPDRTVREAERALESDTIVVQSALRTLRSWDVAEDDITEVTHEAERLKHPNPTRNVRLDKTWSEVELVAPIGGILLEKNVTVGEIIDQNDDLFKIGDVSRLQVVAHVYEEELPLLMPLTAEQRHWQISLLAQPNSPPISGLFDLPGRIIDPAQHTAQVVGWLDNCDGRLVAGQFISAAVEIPARSDDVSVPTSAVFEDGSRSHVLVAVGDDGQELERRAVSVVQRTRSVVRVRSNPSAELQGQGFEPLRAGERVLSSGITLVLSAMKN